MAKGVEDTAFYRWSRLTALNEVGGNPGRLGVSPAAFHAFAARLARDWPATMTTLSTHDTKRGEDVRARLAVLAERPAQWAQEVARWHDLAGRLAGGPPPEPDTEYLMWQTLAGAWPVSPDRITEYLTKAMREAKTRTSWTDQDPAYEAAVCGLARAVLADERLSGQIAAFVARIEPDARASALGAKLVQLTMPGVPDLYQGAELSCLALVDPDNRRPVDFAARERALQTMDDTLAGGTTRADLAAQLLRAWPDGRIKLYLVATVLRHVAACGDWPDRSYAALSAVGTAADHVIAFRRGDAVIVTTRLPHTLAGNALPIAEIWNDTAVLLGEDVPAQFRDVLTGEMIATDQVASSRGLSLADTLRSLPIALLIP
jgi:(1->4)-alpha-D-glucan 1-alpha-D-glucosylmutase